MSSELHYFKKLVVVFCLQAVAVGVLLHGVLDGVRALEELFASLVLLGPGVGIQVFVQKFPHVVGKAQDLKILGISGKRKRVRIASKCAKSLPEKVKLTNDEEKKIASHRDNETYWNPDLNFWATVP